MGDPNTLLTPKRKPNVNTLIHKEPYSDPKFNEIRDLLYDAESHMEKGRKDTAFDILNIVVVRLNNLRSDLNV